MDVLAENSAGWVGEIDLFKDTVRRCDGIGAIEETAMESFFVDADDFTGFDLSDELGFDDVEGAGLGGDHVSSIFELADA